MDIQEWLENLKAYWIGHDVEKVLSLFDEGVEYYETPFLKLSGISDVKNAWKEIHAQKNIQFDYDLFSSYENQHAAIWHLSYVDRTNISKNFSGTYLIRLNEEGRCIYFHHTCEEKN